MAIAPSDRNALAIALPMVPEPPVTKATFPCRDDDMKVICADSNNENLEYGHKKETEIVSQPQTHV
jgi:hypothetical protein